MYSSTSNNVIHYQYAKGSFPTKCIMFDLDSTLIKTKSGNTFTKCIGDWQWYSPTVLEKLYQEVLKNHKIVIVTNQKAYFGTTGKIIDYNIRNVMDKMKKYFETSGGVMGGDYIPSYCIDVFILVGNCEYRKPNPGVYQKYINNGVYPSYAVLYVGDAAGREGDFSDSDKEFALQCKIPFFTPEEFFG